MLRLKKGKRRNKLALILLSPLLCVSFVVGWCLVWMGQINKDKNRSSNLRKRWRSGAGHQVGGFSKESNLTGNIFACPKRGVEPEYCAS